MCCCAARDAFLDVKPLCAFRQALASGPGGGFPGECPHCSCAGCAGPRASFALALPRGGGGRARGRARSAGGQSRRFQRSYGALLNHEGPRPGRTAAPRARGTRGTQGGVATAQSGQHRQLPAGLSAGIPASAWRGTWFQQGARGAHIQLRKDVRSCTRGSRRGGGAWQARAERGAPTAVGNFEQAASGVKRKGGGDAELASVERER